MRRRSRFERSEKSLTKAGSWGQRPQGLKLIPVYPSQPATLVWGWWGSLHKWLNEVRGRFGFWIMQNLECKFDVNGKLKVLLINEIYEKGKRSFL